MKRYSMLFAAALLIMLACSDDEKTPKKGTLTVDDKSYALHQLFGMATLGTDHSHFEFIIANDKIKVKDEEPTGKGINLMALSFTREETVSEEPVTGTFTYNDDLEIYEIDNVFVGLGLDANDEDDGTYYEDFDLVSATISKSGSTYTIGVVGTIDGTEITVSYKGKIKMLPTENEDDLKRVEDHCAIERWM